jgi:hypothetical protein
MSEETNGQAPEAAKKPKTEVTKVTMKDGREVGFAGKRNLNKDFKIADDKSGVTATFDFRTGDTLSLTVSRDDDMILQLAGHGLVQKAGDEAAGVKDAQGQPDVPSMVLAIEAILNRVANTEASLEDRWYAETAEGGGFSGASVVIKAIMEATGKELDFVKAFLEKRLNDDKAAKGTLTRQKLYASFRKPGTKTAAIIERMEREKLAAATTGVDADAELAAMQG